MIISSLENKRIKDIKKLYDKQKSSKEELFIVEGEHLVKEAYNNKLLKTIIIKEGMEPNIPCNDIIYVTLPVLKKISLLDTPNNIMGICYKKKEEKIGNSILVLDNIQDPGNLGTIIRSAVAFNIDTIILSSDTVSLYNSKVIRSTQGMLFSINIIEKNLEEFLPILHDEKYFIYGTNVINGKSLKTIEKRNKFAIIMGNEGNGVKESLKKYIDSNIYIDMNKNCESLNVAVAASIILYEFMK